MNMQTRSPRVRRTTGPPKFVNSKSMFRGDTPPNYKQLEKVRKWTKNDRKWTKILKFRSCLKNFFQTKCFLSVFTFFWAISNFFPYSSVANSQSLASVSQSESRKVSNSRMNHIMATVPAPKYSTASMREHSLQKLASRAIPIAGYTHCSGNEVKLESDFGSTIDTTVSEAKF